MITIKGSSSITRLEFHISFKVKYCHRVFDIPEIKRRCEQIFYSVSQKYKFLIKEIGFDGDHVHMIILTKITQSLDQVSKWLKGTSGYKILKEFPIIKKTYFWGSGLWSPVIYADAVGASGQNPERLHSYVKNQGKR